MTVLAKSAQTDLATGKGHLTVTTEEIACRAAVTDDMPSMLMAVQLGRIEAERTLRAIKYRSTILTRKRDFLHSKVSVYTGFGIRRFLFRDFYCLLFCLEIAA